MIVDQQPVRPDTSPWPPLRPALILGALGHERVDYVLIGGLAAQLYGDPHPTRSIDICPDRDPANLGRLRNVLVKLGAQQVPPGFGDLALPIERHRLEIGAPTLTQTIAGALDIVPFPYGIPGGYDQLAARAHQRAAHGVQVQVADLADVLHSARCGTRPKDAPTMARLIVIAERVRRDGRQPARSDDGHLGLPPEHVAVPPDDPSAAGSLGLVCYELRPALDAARHGINRALGWYPGRGIGTQRGRLSAIRHDVNTSINAIAEIRYRLSPQLCDRRIDGPDSDRAMQHPAAVLAFRVHDDVLRASRILHELRVAPTDSDLTTGSVPLLDARVLINSADRHADQLESHLARAARTRERDVPTVGPDV